MQDEELKKINSEVSQKYGNANFQGFIAMTTPSPSKDSPVSFTNIIDNTIQVGHSPITFVEDDNFLSENINHFSLYINNEYITNINGQEQLKEILRNLIFEEGISVKAIKVTADINIKNIIT